MSQLSHVEQVNRQLLSAAGWLLLSILLIGFTVVLLNPAANEPVGSPVAAKRRATLTEHRSQVLATDKASVVDAGAGVYRIPVSRAMDLVVNEVRSTQNR